MYSHDRAIVPASVPQVGTATSADDVEPVARAGPTPAAVLAGRSFAGSASGSVALPTDLLSVPLASKSAFAAFSSLSACWDCSTCFYVLVLSACADRTPVMMTMTHTLSLSFS